MNEVYNIQEYIPASMAIGDDERGNALLYAIGSNGFGIYLVSFGNLDVNEMVYIADSLESFFIRNEGVRVFTSM